MNSDMCEKPHELFHFSFRVKHFENTKICNVFHQSENTCAVEEEICWWIPYHTNHISDSDLCDAVHEQFDLIFVQKTLDSTDIWMVFHSSGYEDAGLG